MVQALQPPPRADEPIAILNWVWSLYNTLQTSVVKPLTEIENRLDEAAAIDLLDTTGAATASENRTKINEILASLKEGGGDDGVQP